MKSHTHIIATFCIFATIALTLAEAYHLIEVSGNWNKALRSKATSRNRRDLTGVFDSIANGFEGLKNGTKEVSSSIMQAFEKVFSQNNLNAMTDGFTKFKQGVKDAFSGLFGSNGVVSNGFKKIGNSFTKNDNPTAAPSGDKVEVPKSDPPAGEVPNEETT